MLPFDGTHQGQFMDMAPTGKRISVRAVEVVRVADGRVMEHWSVTDQMGMMQQLGATPE